MSFAEDGVSAGGESARLRVVAALEGHLAAQHAARAELPKRTSAQAVALRPIQQYARILQASAAYLSLCLRE